MVDNSDERRRREDLGWLYGSPRPKSREDTTAMDPDELAALRGAPQQKPGPRGSGQRTPPPPRQPASPRQADRPPARRRRRRRGRVLRTLGALLVLWLVYLLAMPLLAWSLGSTVDSIPEGDRPANQPGTAILLVGSDSRQDLTQQQRIELGTGSTDGSRTDTMMILYTPRTGRSVLISLPRDSYVAIPGQGRSKLNAAYALGGPKLLMQTVEQNTGLRMDGYLEVGFTGFVGVVDAVGGVDVCLDNPIQDQDSHLDLQDGCQTLDGVTALGYVRMRKADPRGDFGRMQRQREVIGLLVHKIVSPWTVLNPIRWFRVNWAAKDSLRRGADTGLTALPGLVRGMYSVSIGNGLTLTVPVSNPNAATPAGSSVIWDENAAKDMFGQIASGDTSRLDEFAK